MQDSLKALHIIGFVTWFAALFYLVRILIYFVEAGKQEEPKKTILREQYTIMGRRLYYFIAIPAMVITLTFGIWLLVTRSYLLDPEAAGSAWMHVKLSLVFLLAVYHHLAGAMVKKMKKGTIRWSSISLRMFNELPTIILVAVVFLAVKKNTTSFLYATGYLTAFLAVMFTLSVVMRKQKEKRAGEKVSKGS
jgi:putative membrane protein